MNFLESIALGIIQGITEFLPISSSGHLILARDFFGIQALSGLAFDAVLQLATTLAILVYFRKEVIRLIESFFKIVFRKEHDSRQRAITIAIILGTIPAIGFGLVLEGLMETMFRNSMLVVFTLLLGAGLMEFAERMWKKKGSELKKITPVRGFWIGLFQSLALVPGMSRSGMTISGGLFLGLGREEATRFSFLLALPILLGSGFKKLLDLGTSGLLDSIGLQLLIGSIVSFVVGILAIHFLITFLRRHTMKVFIWYRVGLAIFLVLFLI